MPQNPVVDRDRIVSIKFMRKYIQLAKETKPVLTRHAADFIADEYSKLRNVDNLQQDNVARVFDWKINNFFFIRHR